MWGWGLLPFPAGPGPTHLPRGVPWGHAWGTATPRRGSWAAASAGDGLDRAGMGTGRSSGRGTKDALGGLWECSGGAPAGFRGCPGKAPGMLRAGSGRSDKGGSRTARPKTFRAEKQKLSPEAPPPRPHRSRPCARTGAPPGSAPGPQGVPAPHGGLGHAGICWLAEDKRAGRFREPIGRLPGGGVGGPGVCSHRRPAGEGPGAHGAIAATTGPWG